MLMWAVGFPTGEILLGDMGSYFTSFFSHCSSPSASLMVFWIVAEGMPTVLAAPWWRGVTVGGIGFGFGAIIAVGRSKNVRPCNARDRCRHDAYRLVQPLRLCSINENYDLQLLGGIALAMVGGLLVTGVRLLDGIFGLGALFCLLAICLFAWATRKTTRDFQTLSSLGQTTVTLVGSLGHYTDGPWVFSYAGFWPNGDWQHGFPAYHDAVDLLFACHSHLTTTVDLGGWEIGYFDGVSSYECCAILCDAHRCNVLG